MALKTNLASQNQLTLLYDEQSFSVTNVRTQDVNLTIDSVENVSAIIRTTAMSSAMDTCDSVTQEYTHGYRLWLAQH